VLLHGAGNQATSAAGATEWGGVSSSIKAIGRLFTLYCSGGRHGHQFWLKISSCGIVESRPKASVQKAQNEPSTQLIKATICAERWNATMKAEELSYLSIYQMLTMDKNHLSYQSPKKLVEKYAVND